MTSVVGGGWCVVDGEKTPAGPVFHHPPSTIHHPLLRALLALLLLAQSSGGTMREPVRPGLEAELPQGIVAHLRPGMTPEQVRQVMGGSPRRAARQILYHRYLEQWLYDQPTSVRLEFDCRRGQPARLQSILPE